MYSSQAKAWHQRERLADSKQNFPMKECCTFTDNERYQMKHFILIGMLDADLYYHAAYQSTQYSGRIESLGGKRRG